MARPDRFPPPNGETIKEDWLTLAIYIGALALVYTATGIAIFLTLKGAL